MDSPDYSQPSDSRFAGTSIGIDDVRSLYEMSFTHFVGYAYALTSSPDTSHDVVQTVFSRIISSIQQGRSLAIDNLKAYLFAGIRNEVLNRSKRNSRYSRLHIVQENPPSIESTYISSYESQVLEDAIHTLPPIQKMCLVMYYFDNLKMREIADELSMSESSVKTHLQRAKKKLQIFLEKNSHNEMDAQNG